MIKISTQIVPSLQYDVIVVKKEEERKKKKKSKNLLLSEPIQLGGHPKLFSPISRWGGGSKIAGKLLMPRWKKGGGVIREGQSAQQLNIIFVNLTCFNLTNLFGEEKIRWLPSMKWKFSEAHKFSRHNMYNVQFIYQQFCF